jgi:hypothetical protein
MNEKNSNAPLTARKIFALMCMALPCGAFIALWVVVYFRPHWVYDGWMISEGLVDWNIASAFGFALHGWILVGWLFIAGVWLCQKPFSVFNTIFTVLAALIFLYAVWVGVIYAFH